MKGKIKETIQHIEEIATRLETNVTSLSVETEEEKDIEVRKEKRKKRSDLFCTSYIVDHL